MQIERINNNGVYGYQIIDGTEAYFIDVNLSLPIEQQEQFAIEKYNAIKYREANPPPPSYQVLREKEMPSEHDLIVALWEHVVENRPEEKDKLQTQRVTIKQKYPKP